MPSGEQLMSLITCKECGHQVATSAKACPKCGARVPRTKWWLWVPLGAVAAFLAFGAVVGNTPEGKQSAQERMAIDLCWSEQSRKSLSSSETRFVAGACEMMEERFRAKWNRAP
jgi:ribosomal protein L40E